MRFYEGNLQDLALLIEKMWLHFRQINQGGSVRQVNWQRKQIQWMKISACVFEAPFNHPWYGLTILRPLWRMKEGRLSNSLPQAHTQTLWPGKDLPSPLRSGFELVLKGSVPTRQQIWMSEGWPLTWAKNLPLGMSSSASSAPCLFTKGENVDQT